MKIPHASKERWSTDHPDFPNRQLQRKTWLQLDGEWKFAYDDSLTKRNPIDVKEYPLKIKVPFAPETKASGIGDQGFHGSCWYERMFELKLQPKHRAHLHFGAADYRAQVWVNGRFVGEHEGGHTPFWFDITEALSAEGVQRVTVWVQDDPHDLAKPRGKQDWQLEPHSIWYPRTTGLWQTVWLEEVPDTFLESITWSPQVERWEIGVEAHIGGMPAKNLQLRVRLNVGDRCIASDFYEVIDREVHRKIALSDPGIDDYRNELLWSPEKPTLIEADIELFSDGKLVDHVRSYTAIRSVQVARGRFLLNNRPYYLRLVLDQGYWPDTFMTPPSEDAIVRDIELVKAAGFNGVRKHQKIEDPRFLYWADVMGLLVWEEMPSAYRFTHMAVERLINEWTEVLDRDINHPCIITWVPFNESWGVPDLPGKEAHRACVQAFYYMTKTLDTTRPVVGNDGWESTATDILGIHDYDDNPKRLAERYGETSKLPDMLRREFPGGRMLTLEGHEHRGQPVLLTEFGGIAFRDPRLAGGETWGYSVSRTSGDFQTRYEKLLETVSHINMFAGFCYTQFTDTFQEANGLFFADRSPKFTLEEMREATHGRPRAKVEAQAAQPPTTVVQAAVPASSPNAGTGRAKDADAL